MSRDPESIESATVRLANAAERIAEALEKSVEMNAASSDFAKNMLSGGLKTVLAGVFTPPSAVAEPYVDDLRAIDPSMLCVCFHDASTHIEGDGPCTENKCPCEKFTHMTS